MHWLIANKVAQRLDMLKPLAARRVAGVEKIEWFTTPKYLPYEEAWRGPFEPFSVGRSWGEGGASEKAYFKLSFALPEACKGRKTWLRVRTGGEGMCFRPDGSPWQGLDWERADLLVSEAPEGGERFELLLEVIPSRSYWADFRGAVTFDLAEISVANGAVGRAALLGQLCFDLAKAAGETSLRGERLLRAVDEAVDLFPWGEEEAEAYAGPAERAAEMLWKALAKRGAEGRLTLEAMPSSHIDTAWLWPFSETVRKCGRTFSTAITYMRQYPHYRFVESQAALYEFARQHYPRLYADIKERVKEGRWEVTGAMWVEPDMNLVSGESLVRQLLLGNGFFEREFGSRTKVLWLPDVFGYSAALPQVLRRSGVPYFITHKLGVNEENLFPYAWFRWEGIDGSQVLAHIQQVGYGERFDVDGLVGAERARPTPELDFVPFMFGLGDGGGGPTEQDVRRMPLLEDVAGLPRVRFRPVTETFEEAEGAELPVWRGELYFENHRGTYTTQAAMKRLNRECELALREAEMLAAWEMLLGGKAEADTFRPLWETVCLHQFHDILPGSSRRMVYEEGIPTLTRARDEVRRLAAESLERLTEPAKGKTAVANTLSWPRVDAIRLPGEYAGVLPTQDTAEGKLALVSAPGMGLFEAAPAEAECLEADGYILSNRWVRAEFNEKGQLVSLLDRERNREALAEGEIGNELRLHEDRPAPGRYGGGNDAWDIHVFYEKKYRTLEAERAELVEAGPIRATIRFTYRWERGEIMQEASLYAHSRRVEFRTQAVWNEDQRMLRAYFPLAVNADQATYEIQFGHLRRPTHRNTSWEVTKFEVSAHTWADVSEDGFGVALLNDCKYGHAALGNRLSMTLLRATTSPDPVADRGEHEFTYAVMPHGEGLLDVLREAHALNAPLLAAADRAPRRTIQVPVSAEHVVVSAMKPAENGEGVIVRCYEALNRRGPVEVSVPGAGAVVETNLVEDDEDGAAGESGAVRFEVKPFEIRTFRALVER